MFFLYILQSNQKMSFDHSIFNKTERYIYDKSNFNQIPIFHITTNWSKKGLIKLVFPKLNKWHTHTLFILHTQNVNKNQPLKFSLMHKEDSLCPPFAAAAYCWRGSSRGERSTVNSKKGRKSFSKYFYLAVISHCKYL
jgi:hypothetical protein